MQSNLRFYVLVVIVFAVLVGAWYAISGKKAEVQTEPLAAQSAKEPEKTSSPPLAPLGDTGSRAVRGDQPMRSVLSGTTKATTESTGGDGSITGIVNDPRGNPAPGATVRILAMRWERDEERPEDATPEETRTGSDGKFSFTDLPEKMRFGIEAELGPQYAVDSVYISEREKTTDVTLTLMPSSFIAGTVVDPDGEPVAGAALYATHWQDQSDDLPYIETEITRRLTDESGAFRFPHVPMGKFKFLVKSKGYAPLLTEWVISGTESAEFMLRKGGSIAGRAVYADSREPVGNVTILARTDVSREEQRQQSESDGSFTFANLRDTAFNLSIDSETLIVAKESAKIDLSPAQNVTGVEIAVDKGGSVSGRVADAKTSKGVRNARLQLYSDSRGGSAIRVSKDATTDEDGAYTIGGLPTGNFSIFVSQAEGYVSDDYQKRQVVSVTAGQSLAGIDFLLDSGCTLAGQVVDEAGDPVAKARINVTSKRGGRWASAESDVNGLFTVMGVVAESEVFARAEKKGMASTPVGPLDATGGAVNDVVITLHKQATISGVVVDDAGTPVPRAEVIPYTVGDRQGFGSPVERANEKGEFTLEGLAEGEYQLQANIGNGGWSRNPNAEVIRVAAGDAKTGVRVVLQGAGGLSIAGKVTGEDGKPVRSANIWVMSRTSNGNAQTDSDGRYKVAGLKEGAYSVSVQASGYSRGSLNEVAAGSENADIVLKGTGKIEGKVVDAATGKPVTDFEIVYSPNGRPNIRDFQHMGPGARTHSEDGAFHIESAEAGSAALLVKGQGYAPKVQSVTDIVPGETKRDVVVSLDAGGLVAGRVLDSSGNPVAGAQVYDTPVPLADYSREQSLRTTSAEDGSYQLDGLPNGTVTISAYHPNHAGANVQVDVAPGKTTQANIVLRGGGSVRIRVMENGVPVTSNAYAGVQEKLASDSAAQQPDGSGIVEFKGLPPGSYRAYCGLQDPSGSGAPHRNQSREVTVTEGNVTEVAFDFTVGTASVIGTVTFNGQPPTRAWVNVSLTSSDTAGEESRNIEADADGQFRLENLPAGQARLKVHGSLGELNASSRLRTVELVDGKASDVTIELGGGGTVSGTVSGIPADNRIVVAVVRGTISPPPHMTQDELNQLYRDDLIAASALVDSATGAFTVGNVEPGQYTSLATATDNAGNVRCAAAPVAVKEGETSTVSLALPQ